MVVRVGIVRTWGLRRNSYNGVLYSLANGIDDAVSRGGITTTPIEDVGVGSR